MNLPDWESFYVIVGSSAGALIGLQFVVLTLIADRGHAAIVVRRARRQTDYQPDREDWVWYLILPCVGYLALFVAAVLQHANLQAALFIVAATALGLLLIGIHNAWDTVSHIVVTSSRKAD